MNNKKIELLNKLINVLQDGLVYFKANDLNYSSVGNLIKLNSGYSDAKFEKIINDLYYIRWSDIIMHHTIPLNYEYIKSLHFLDALFANGITREELIQLESLSNPIIASKCNFTNLNIEYKIFGFVIYKKPNGRWYKEKPNVIEYLKQWVKILESENQEPEFKNTTCYNSEFAHEFDPDFNCEFHDFSDLYDRLEDCDDDDHIRI